MHETSSTTGLPLPASVAGGFACFASDQGVEASTTFPKSYKFVRDRAVKLLTR